MTLKGDTKNHITSVFALVKISKLSSFLARKNGLKQKKLGIVTYSNLCKNVTLMQMKKSISVRKYSKKTCWHSSDFNARKPLLTSATTCSNLQNASKQKGATSCCWLLCGLKLCKKKSLKNSWKCLKTWRQKSQVSDSKRQTHHKLDPCFKPVRPFKL